MVEAAITGEGFQLVLRVLSYERPQLESGADANWLTGEAELTVDPSSSYRAKQALALRTEELAAFRDQLSKVLEDLEGEATLEHMEEQVGCTVTLRGGEGEFSGFVRQHVGGDLRVRGLAIDQSYLRDALRAIDKLVREFPIRGDPFE